MLVAGQRMADEHQVRLVGVERAVGLIGDGEGREFLPAVERQRIVEMRDLALRIGDLRKPNGKVWKACDTGASLITVNPGVHSVREASIASVI